MQTESTKSDFGSKMLKKEPFVKDLMYIAAQGSTSERAFDEDVAEKNIDLNESPDCRIEVGQKRTEFFENVIHQLFEKTPSFMAILRGDTYIFEFANTAYLNMVGHYDIIGKTLVEALPALKDQIIFELLDQVMQTGKPYIGSRTKFLLRPRQEAPFEERYLDFIYHPLLNSDGTISGIFIEGHDVTDQYLFEDALSQADLRKNEFLAMLAHELRNPLAPIRHAARISQMPGVTPAEIKWSLEVIERQSENMGKMLDDLLDISRITSGKLCLQKKQLALNDSLLAMIETVRPFIEAREHSFTVTIPAETVYIDADPVRFDQIFYNLLNNAAKYTESGGIIRVEVKLVADDVQITVSDNGIGIPPEAISDIFGLFSQATIALERSEGGLGIGLSLVRGLIVLHGGTIEARSGGVGMGSEFVVNLPRSTVVSILSEAGDAPLDDYATIRKGLRVLIVDDNRDNADLSAMFFKKSGQEVRIAYSGVEAIRIAGEFYPQFVILDIGMPGMNGYEVAKWIRSTAWGGEVVLIAVTGYGQEDDILKSKVAGFDQHITKPFALKKLDQLLAD